MSIGEKLKDLIKTMEPVESMYGLTRSSWSDRSFSLTHDKHSKNTLNGEFWHDMVVTCLQNKTDGLTKIVTIDQESTLHQVRWIATRTLTEFINRKFTDDKQKPLRVWYKHYIFNQNQYVDLLLYTYKAVAEAEENQDEAALKNTAAFLEAYYIKNFKPEHMPAKKRRKGRR
jgi:hypothetical protein